MLKSAPIFVLMLSILFFSSNCKNVISDMTDSVYMDYDYEKLGYKLFEPKSKFFLSYDLEEISGLTYLEENLLGAIEDEKGVFYLLNSTNGEIEDRFKFSDRGDYEGIERIGNEIYVLESDGDLHTFSYAALESIESKKIETPLSRSNDVEGLGKYSATELVLITKASGDIDDNKVKGKGAYVYDISSGNFLKKELFSLDKDEIEAFIEKRDFFNRIIDFDPSAIAIHPITQNIFVLSADGVLVILNQKFELNEVIRLHPVVYNQAEGICFSPDGTLYISTEGDGGKAKLLTIAYDKK